MQTVSALPEQARKRGLAVLLGTSFFTWGGFFAVIPLITVHYVDNLGWTAASVGAVLAARQFLQQGISSVTGAIADRIGAKPLICFGMGLRIISFSMVAIADSYLMLLAAMILMGIGGGFFEAPEQAAIVALTTPEERRRFFSLNGVVAGLGTSLGTQAGAFALGADFTTVALVGVGAFTAVFLMNLFFLPSVKISIGGRSATAGLKLALGDRLFMLFNILLLGYMFMWAQYSISLPLFVTNISGPQAVAWVYAVNSAVMIAFGYLLPRFLEDRVSNFNLLTGGIVLIAIGMGSIALVDSIFPLLICVFVFSVGMVLARPGQQTTVAGLARPEALGAFMGIGQLSMAFGGGAGNFLGGVIYDASHGRDLQWMPWVIFGLIGMSSVVGLIRIKPALDQRQAENEALSAAALQEEVAAAEPQPA
ncbi:MAG: MFS transporter [Thermomicrobiales bacterium]|nr:MFS transporter [Thermomicrobiales bacterium]